LFTVDTTAIPEVGSPADGRAVRAERREQKLVRSLAEQLESAGHEACRLPFRPDGELRTEIVGHADEEITNSIYTHTSDASTSPPLRPISTRSGPSRETLW
jgi:hypothetical protein